MINRLREIELSCLPTDVPEHIVVEVADLDIGDTVRVADLKLDASRITLLSEPDLVVLTIIASKLVEAEEEVEEAVEAEAEPEVIKKGKADEEGEGS